MQLGLVGLGKMGFNMRERLREGGHEVVGYDPRPEVTDVPTLAALADALAAPRVVWVMVPSGPVTHETIAALADELAAGDLVIDGGNVRNAPAACSICGSAAPMIFYPGLIRGGTRRRPR